VAAHPISGLPEIGIIDAQVGYSRLACAALEGCTAKIFKNVAVALRGAASPRTSG
jgi:hypothetical protein